MNSGILQLAKMGPFWGASCAAQCASGWLLGPVRGIVMSVTSVVSSSTIPLLSLTLAYYRGISANLLLWVRVIHGSARVQYVQL